MAKRVRRLNRDPREPREPGDLPAVDTSPIPISLPPLLAFHVYGLNWDLTGPSGQPVKNALANQFAGIFGQVDVQIRFQVDFAGSTGPIPVLSLGVWKGNAPNNPMLANARNKGLDDSRMAGSASGTGEILIDSIFLRLTIDEAIPRVIRQNGVTASLFSESVSELPPAFYAILATYDTDAPVFYPHPTCSSTIGFMAVGGGINVDISPIDCGGFGVPESLASNLFNPLTGLALGTGVLAYGYTVIHNLGSNVAAFPNLSIGPVTGPWTQNLFPREIPSGPLKFALTYGSPGFFTNSSGLSRLRLPFNWTQPVLRMPTVSISGSRAILLSADLTPPTGTFTYSAVTSDLVAPSFEWTLNGQVIGNGVHAPVTFTAPGARNGATRTFRLGVRAVDSMITPGMQPLEARAEIVITATIRAPRGADL